ncbi:importin subunit alpha-5 [Pelomyxa schiedti]|nr:importin subunit alpha-5 [Pelomyxa schiedti]
MDGDAPSRGTVAEMCRGVMSPDFSIAMNALVELRTRVSSAPPPIDEVLAVPGCVARIIQFLSASDNTNLQYEALWVLTNLCSGTDTNQTLKVVELGALPQVISLLSSPNARVCEQAIWALGNIVGTSTELRNAILELGYIPAVVNAMHTFQNSDSLLKIAIWAFSVGCRGKPPPPDKYFIPTPTFDIFPTLVAFLRSSDLDIIYDTIWSLCYLTEITDFSKHITASGICSNIVIFLDLVYPKVHPVALRTLGNIVLGSDTETQVVVDAGVLPKLLPLLNSPDKPTRREACWLLSNIAAGTSGQICSIAAEPGLFEQVIALTSSSESLDIRKEAAWVVCNAVSGGSTELIKRLFNRGALREIVELLDTLDCTDKDLGLLATALRLLETATSIDAREASDVFTLRLINDGVIAKLRRIQRDTKNKSLAGLASKLLLLLDKDKDIEKSTGPSGDSMDIE